jgi:hypothetical protein
LHKIQEFLEHVWQDMAARKSSSMATALTTNFALELACKNEQEVLSLMPNLHDEGSYTTMIKHLLHVAVASMLSQDEKTFDIGETSKAPQFDEFVYSSTFSSLINYKKNHVPVNNDFLAVVPISATYAKYPNLTPSNPDWAAEDQLLDQMLLDLDLPLSFKATEEEKTKGQCVRNPAQKWPKGLRLLSIQDAATMGLQSVVERGLLDTRMVFKARIILDIHKVFGIRVSQGYKDLLLRGAEVAEATGVTWSRDPEVMNARGGRVETLSELHKKWSGESARYQAIKLSQDVQVLIRENRMVGFKQSLEHMSRLGPAGLRSSLGFVSAHPDPAFFYKNNPIYCGLESLKPDIGLEHLGIDLANSFCSFAAVAHLYNALQQSERIQGRWNTLDKVIEAHMHALFRGGLPTKEEQTISCFMLCMGVPYSSFASKHKGPNMDLVLKKQK